MLWENDYLHNLFFYRKSLYKFFLSRNFFIDNGFSQFLQQLYEIEDIREIPLLGSRNYT